MDIFPKMLSTKFHENPASGNLVACGRTDRQTAMMQLSSLSAILRTRLKWQTPRTKIDDQADIEQCSNEFEQA
jgi:hypothetical protein